MANNKGTYIEADKCSFCGLPITEVGVLFSGADGAAICDQCIERGYETLMDRELHFSSSCEFPKCSFWGVLVGATPLHLLSQTALPLKSPTGAFIAALRFANAVPPQTLLMVRT